MPPLWLSCFLAFLPIFHIVLCDDPDAQLEGPSYEGKDPCPAHCSVAGPLASNWSVYHNIAQLGRCDQRLFLDFSVVDDVDDPNTLHRLRACTIWGTDWENTAPSYTLNSATKINATFEVGWWEEAADRSINHTNAGQVFSMARQLSLYFSRGYGLVAQPSVVFAMSGSATFGVFIGRSLQNDGIGQVALRLFSDFVGRDGITPGGIAMQLCGPGRDSDHAFGAIAVVNGTFKAVRDAITTWSSAGCLGGFASVTNLTAPIFVTAPPLVPIANDTLTAASDLNVTLSNSTALAETLVSVVAKRHGVVPRADCRTIQVVSGDSCAILASKCNIPGADITKYNTQANFCATLQPYQHICCGPGTLPDFTPKPNPDGSCATYTTVAGDSCYAIAAQNTLAVANLETLNKNTWGWNGCDNLWVGVNMCLSAGTPPMPAAVPNAVCGPQVPGTGKPPTGTDLSALNPCPLNACCDVWGQCGTTAEFCTNTSTGAPGTAQKGTNGCISNCGTNIIRSSPPVQFRNIAYFEGYNLGRSCLNMDANQLDTSKYTHIHFAFATLTDDFEVIVGDQLASFEFEAFKSLKGSQRILSFGGWDFSTGSSTYMIFRNGVLPANRLTLATNIASFIKQNGLDGVDIDWEYPGAPDIPGIPAASLSDGANYLAFLVILKNLLSGKSVSVAAPASYWYLRGFPIQQIGAVVDYIVYMTYDLHGQWDYGNKWSDPGCPGGDCLRSGVNVTETINALVMITKAGVPSNKVVVGVTSYGRAYELNTPGCYSPDCTYTGPASGAAKGRCTGVAGYISDAEIKEIVNSGRVTADLYDPSSQTNILVYDNNQWVGWMDPNTKATRISLYRALDFGGVSDWAVSLEDFQPPPSDAWTKSWSDFILQIKLGSNPQVKGPRTGNWSHIPCTVPAVDPALEFPPDVRWSMLDADNAWKDAINIWQTIDGPGGADFMQSLSDTYNSIEELDCRSLLKETNCDQTVMCKDDAGTGPAGYLIVNSLVKVHEAYANYLNALWQMAGVLLGGFQNFQNHFAPVPDESNEALQIILDLIGLGLAMVGGLFFNIFLRKLDFFVAHAASVDNLKDASYAFIATGISIAKDLTNTPPNDWTIKKQAEFTDYMGQTIWAWSNITEQTVENLFNGTDENIASLWSIISNGKMIEGNVTSTPDHGTRPQDTPDEDNKALQASIERVFYGYTIPLTWDLSGTRAFILDSGSPCGTVDPVSPRFLDSDSAQGAWACHSSNNRLYYLAYPKGEAQFCCCECDGCPPSCTTNAFSVPPGVDALDGAAWGGLTRQQLIDGAVNSYLANGGKNGGPSADIGSKSSLDDMYNQDITTPGFILIPVCGPQEAWDNWYNQTNTGYANFPCNN